MRRDFHRERDRVRLRTVDSGKALEFRVPDPFPSRMQIAQWLHVLGVVVWVGGMFFAHMALRPSLPALEPPQRLPLLVAVLGRFFRWVALAIPAIVASGAYMIVALGGMAQVGAYVHLMTALGAVMIAIFGYIVALPYRRLASAAKDHAWPAAGVAMQAIRRYVGVNLILGLATTTIAFLGHGF